MTRDIPTILASLIRRSSFPLTLADIGELTLASRFSASPRPESLLSFLSSVPTSGFLLSGAGPPTLSKAVRRRRLNTEHFSPVEICADPR